MDVETNLEEEIELEPLIHVQHDIKIPTRLEARTALAQFLALCGSLFLLGWNDGSTGPLLPRIQKVYNVGFGTVSWIFVLGCTGVVLGALMNMPLNDRLGLGKMLVLGSFCQFAAFFFQYLELPFPLFVLSFTFGGIGMAFQEASANSFIASLQHDSKYKMGFIHAAYGAGALIAPLSATRFAQLTHWSSHYLVSLSLAIFITVVLAGVFRFSPQDGAYIAENFDAHVGSPTVEFTECLQEAGEVVPIKTEEIGIHNNKFGQLMKNKTVHLLAFFLMVYIGVEVTIGGWIVTFMMIVRGGGPNSGYVSTGFFGGLTLGRVILVEVTKKIGDVYAIYIYTLLAIFFQLIVWLVPSFIGGAISVFMIGILLGPIYPLTINHTAHVLPRHLVNGTIGWIAACGAAGSALLPFVTGMMASKLGIESLQPLFLAMMILLGTLWALVPKERPEF